MSDYVRKDGSRWGQRVIRKGTIQWCGRRYRVTDGKDWLGPVVSAEEASRMSLSDRARAAVEYDGRMDGRTATFSTYPRHMTGYIGRCVFLHSFPDIGPTSTDGMDWPGPNCVDGVFRWETWEPDWCCSCQRSIDRDEEDGIKDEDGYLYCLDCWQP